MAKKSEPVRKGLTLYDAHIKLRYLCTPDVIEEVEGVFKGAQPLFSMEEWFVIVRIEEGYDRFIPVANIISVDVISAQSFDIKDDESVQYG